MEGEILQVLMGSGPAGVLALLLWMQIQRTEKRCDKREAEEATRNDGREEKLLERFDSDREAMRKILNLHQEQMTKLNEQVDRLVDKVHDVNTAVVTQRSSQ